MSKTIILIIGLITFDAVVNVAACFLGRKQAKIDKDLTDALLENREAIINRSKLLVKEVECLKTIIDLATKKNQEKGEKKDGKEESESQL